MPVCPESTPLCAPFGWFTVHLEVCVMQFYSECVCTVLSLVHFPVSYNFSPKQVHMSMKFTTQFWCTTLKVSLFTVRRFHSVMKCELFCAVLFLICLCISGVLHLFPLICFCWVPSRYGVRVGFGLLATGYMACFEFWDGAGACGIENALVATLFFHAVLAGLTCSFALAFGTSLCASGWHP